MATYILKAFDRNLAETGFECMMLTGSYGEGSVCEYTAPTDDLKGHGTIVGLANDRLQLTLGITTYIFNSAGRCIEPENSKWRLMLAEEKSELSAEQALNSIAEQLELMNEYLASINASIQDFTSNLSNRMIALDDHITSATSDIIDAMPTIPEFHCNYTPPSNK